jgi:hypothetical protein
MLGQKATTAVALVQKLKKEKFSRTRFFRVKQSRAENVVIVLV